MELRDAYVAWTPNYDDDPEPRKGEVFVGTKAEVVRQLDAKPRLRMWIGVCVDAEDTDIGRTMMMFITFHTLVVRDRIDSLAAHAEFLKIDEYRRRISHDISGAD